MKNRPSLLPVRKLPVYRIALLGLLVILIAVAAAGCEPAPPPGRRPGWHPGLVRIFP